MFPETIKKPISVLCFLLQRQLWINFRVWKGGHWAYSFTTTKTWTWNHELWRKCLLIVPWKFPYYQQFFSTFLLFTKMSTEYYFFINGTSRQNFNRSKGTFLSFKNFWVKVACLKEAANFIERILCSNLEVSILTKQKTTTTKFL